MRESTVAASIVTDMLDYLGRRGVVVDEVSRPIGLDVEELKPDHRVPGSHVERLFEEAERRTQDAHVGLHMGESYHPGALDILGYVVLSCRSAADVLDRLARYAAILNDGLRVRVSREGQRTLCRFEALDGLDNYLARAPRQPLEAMYAGVAITMRNLTGQTIEPLEVTFRHRAPSDVTEYRRVFGRDAQFGAPENLLGFSTSDLDAPVRSSNPELLEVFERHANAIIDELDQLGPVSRRIVRILSERVKGIAPTLDDVASELAMSARSVHNARYEPKARPTSCFLMVCAGNSPCGTWPFVAPRPRRLRFSRGFPNRVHSAEPSGDGQASRPERIARVERPRRL
jgi:hypothetical protein